METRIGQILFAGGLLAGLLFAAPYSPWDEIQLQASDALVKGEKGGTLLLPPQTTEVDGKKDPKQAASLHKLTAQLAATQGSQVWPTVLEIRVQDAMKEKKVVGLEVVFEARSPAKTLASAREPLDVLAPKLGEGDKAPRTYMTAKAPMTPAAGQPTTFDQVFKAALEQASYLLRKQANIPPQNLLPGVLFAAAKSACDPATANGVKDTGIEQLCVPADCPTEGAATEGETKTCGQWKGQGPKPMAAMPADAKAALKWKIAAAMRADYGSKPTLFKDDSEVNRLRGDFAQTKKAGKVRKTMLTKQGLPKPNARLMQRLETNLKGFERDATLELTLTPQAGGAPKTLSAAVNKSFPSTSLYFWLAMALAGVGCILWRMGKTKEARASAAALAQSDSVEGNPFALLRTMLAPTRALADDIETLAEADIMTRTEELLTTYVLPFGDVRTKVTETLGMSAGAEILVVVAFGERMLNRVWTAASDGHAHEARRVFPDVLAAFEKAHNLTEKGAGTGVGAPSGSPSATGAP